MDNRPIFLHVLNAIPIKKYESMIYNRLIIHVYEYDPELADLTINPRVYEIETCSVFFLRPNPNVKRVTIRDNSNLDDIKELFDMYPQADKYVNTQHLKRKADKINFLMELSIHTRTNFMRYDRKYNPGIWENVKCTSQLAHLFYTLEKYPDVLEEIVHLLTK